MAVEVEMLIGIDVRMGMGILKYIAVDVCMKMLNLI